MISDVPVGLLYSGGIDSNIINQYSSVELNRYTGGFPGDYDMEFAKNSTAKSNIIKVNRDEFIDRFNSMIEIRKEPLSVPNEIILSFLAGAWSKTGGKVLLSGEAADELFAVTIEFTVGLYQKKNSMWKLSYLYMHTRS